jgi:integral membrane protein
VPDLIRRFRWVALFEGVSFLVLLGIAMPLKYLAGQPLAVRVVGLVHGLLFLLYVALIAVLCARRQWSTSRGAEALALGLVPFGTFWLDRRIKRAPLA